MKDQPTRYWCRHTSAAVMFTLAAACGGGASATFDSPKALAEALGCGATFEQGEDSFGPSAEQQGSCTIEGETVSFVVMGNREATDALLAMGQKIGCGFDPDGDYYLVRGTNWYINVDTSTQAETLAPSVDGKVISESC